MEIGEVIVNEGNAYVISEIVNGRVTNLDTLEDYIMKNVVIKDDDGRYVTVNQFVKERCADYINGATVHKILYNQNT